MADNKANVFEESLLKYIFWNTPMLALAGLGQGYAGGGTGVMATVGGGSDGPPQVPPDPYGFLAAGRLYISLHLASPANGTQMTSEIVYAGATPYRRVGVPRDPVRWAFTNAAFLAKMVNADVVTFPQYVGPGPTIPVTHFGIGTDATGVGNLLYWAPTTTNPVNLTAGIIPQFAAGAIVVIEK